MKRLVIYLLFIVFSYPIFSQDSVNYKQKVEFCINNKDYDNALRLISIADKEDYFDMESLNNLKCKVYYLTSDYEKAEKQARKLLNDDENSTLSSFIYLACLSKEDKDNLVGRTVEDITQEDIDKNILNDLNIITIKDRKQIISSINNYTANKKLTKDEAYPYKLMLTVLYFSLDNYLESYNNSIDFITTAKQPVIYYILGVLKQKHKEYNSSIAFFNLAIDKGYNSYDAYLNRAISKGYEKSYKSALIDLDTCLLISNNFYPYYLKGINYNFLGDYQSAVEFFNTSIEKNDTFADAYNYRGLVYANLKKYPFAISDFKTAIGLSYKTDFVHNNLGIAYEKSGEIEKAIQEYKISINIEPDLVDAYYNLGRVYTNLKDYNAGVKYLKKALNLDSNIPDVYYLLGINYIGKEKQEKACYFFHQALSLGHTLAQEKINDYCIAQKEKDKKEAKKEDTPLQEDNQEEKEQE